jgi:hypothetical protein
MARYEITTPAGRFEINTPDDFTPEQVQDLIRTQFGGQSELAGLDPNVPKPPTQVPATQPKTDVNTTADVAKSLGAGVVRGGLGLVGLPGSVESLGRAGINAAASLAGYEQAVSPENVLPSGQDLEKRLERVTGPLYQPQTTAGKYARTIGEFAPGVAFPGGMAQRVVGNVLAPAVASETAGQATEGTSLEPYARLGGALAGSFVPGLASRVVSPITQQPERSRQAAIMDAEGVTLTAGQRTGNQRLQVMEQVAAETPLSIGTNTVFQNQAEDFTQAALRRVGENERRATPEVVDRAFDRIGAEFDRLAQNYDLPPSQPMLQQIANSVQDYADLVPNSQHAPVVVNIAQDVLNAFQTGAVIPGQVYQTWRSRLTRLARNARQDPQLEQALLGIRNALDDGMAAVMTPDDAAAWQAARDQYRNMTVIEKTANRGGAASAEGIITPANLRGATATQNQRAYARGQGDFGELARAGNATMTSFPNSGTPARLQAQWGFGALGTAGGAMYGGGPGAVAGAVASPLLQAASASLFMSPPMQAYLANQLATPIRNAINGRQSVVATSPQLLDLYDQAQRYGSPPR